MEIINIVAIALIQGLTEFLPISSSGHLVLLPQLLDWTDQGVGIDVAAHLGSLVAVLLFFASKSRDESNSEFKFKPVKLIADCGPLVRVLTLRPKSQKASYFSAYILGLAVATLPVAALGFFFRDFVASDLRTIKVVAYSTIFFGLILGFADRFRGKKTLNDLSLGCLIIIGIAQSLALVPGVSRSGITITAALVLGFSRKAAVSISAILAVPVIGLSAGFELSHFLQIADHRMVFDLVLVLGMSCLAAYISLLFLFKLVDKVGMTPFVIYRIFLGGVLLLLFVD